MSLDYGAYGLGFSLGFFKSMASGLGKSAGISMGFLEDNQGHVKDLNPKP